MFEIIFIVLVILKLFHLINLSWLGVFSPLLIHFGIYLIIYLLSSFDFSIDRWLKKHDYRDLWK